MKQKFLLKTMLLLLCMIVGASGTWANENDTHDFSQSFSQLLNNNATISSIEIAQQSYPVKKIVLSYRYNKTIANAVTVAVSVGGNSWGSKNVVGTGSNYTTMEFSGDATTGAVVLSFTNNTGSGTGHGTFYVNNVQLTEGASGPATYTVTYDGNGNTSGTVPTDATAYSSNAIVTVKDNTGSLAKSGYTFGGWNTQANGEGTNYSKDDTFVITANTTLYANWNPCTITAVSNDNDYGTVAGTTTITATPAEGYRVVAGDGGYTVSSGEATVVNNGDNTFSVTPTSNCTVQINFEAIPTHTATFSVNGVTTTQDFAEGAAIVFPANPADISDNVFVGWTTSAIVGTTNDKPEFVTTATMGTEGQTYYAVFASVIKGSLTTVTDELTKSTTGITGTTYTDFGGKQSNSDAEYGGNCAGGNSSIQLRSKDDSGIISTVSGGKVKKISVVWNSNTLSGRTLTIYGKNTAYTNSSNLYESLDTQGNELGEIVYGTSTELTVTGDYTYVGIRSKDGALYLDKISIDWQTGTPDTYSDYCTTVVAAAVEKPSIAIAENPFLFSTTATITCATEGAAIKYSFDGETWNDYKEALTITEAKTIYAKAIKGDDESSIVQVTATKNLAEPTVTISATDITNTNVFTGTAAGSLAASVTYNDAAVEGAAVTWSGNNDEVATIDPSTGAVTLVAAGTVTFTATYAGNGDYSEKAATYEMTVTNFDPNAPGTENNPYTVAQAISAIDAGTGIANVYATGKISQIDSYNSTYHSITYWISNDGKTTGDQLEVYSGKGLNNADFSALTDLKVNDEVVIYGTLKKYGEIYEFDKNNYIVSLVRKPTPELTWSAVSYTATYGESNTYPTLTNPNSVTVAYSSSDTNIATIDPSTGEITLKANGETDITASFAGDATYSAQEVSYTLTVTGLKESSEISFEDAEINMAYDEDYEGQALTNPNSVTVTYESSDTDVADVDENTGVVALYKAGTVTITANFAGNETYAACSASYTLNVAKAEAGLAFAAPGPFYVNPNADFDVPALTNPHGLAVEWSSTDEDVAVADADAAVIGSKLGTAVITASFAGDDCYKAGEASYTIIVSNDVVVTWDLSTDQTATATETEMTWTNTNVTMAAAKDDATTATNNYYPGGGDYTSTRFYKNSTLTITPKNGFAIKSVVFTATTDGYASALASSSWTNATAAASAKTVTVTPKDGVSAISAEIGATTGHSSVVVYLTKSFGANLNSEGYATFAANAPLDFSDDSEFSAWQIIEVNGSSIIFSKITGAVAAGTGVLLMGNASTNISIPVAASGDNISATNKLTGITTATAIVADTYYGLKGNTFVKVNAGTIPAGKALLPASEIPSGARELNFVFEGEQTTSVSEECRVKSEEFATATIFDLQGRKVNKPQKGLYIVNGRKVVVK